MRVENKRIVERVLKQIHKEEGKEKNTHKLTHPHTHTHTHSLSLSVSLCVSVSVFSLLSLVTAPSLQAPSLSRSIAACSPQCTLHLAAAAADPHRTCACEQRPTCSDGMRARRRNSMCNLMEARARVCVRVSLSLDLKLFRPLAHCMSVQL